MLKDIAASDREAFLLIKLYSAHVTPLGDVQSLVSGWLHGLAAVASIAAATRQQAVLNIVNNEYKKLCTYRYGHCLPQGAGP